MQRLNDFNSCFLVIPHNDNKTVYAKQIQLDFLNML